MHLGHLLGVATQGAPAGAGGLIQAQLPGTEQRKGKCSRREAMKMEGEGASRVGKGRGAVFSPDVAHLGQSSWASCCSILTQGCPILPQGKSNLLSTH